MEFDAAASRFVIAGLAKAPAIGAVGARGSAVMVVVAMTMVMATVVIAIVVGLEVTGMGLVGADGADATRESDAHGQQSDGKKKFHD
jgi:hypothetical protein